MADAPVALLIAIPTSLDALICAVREGTDYARRYAEDPGRRWSEPGGYRENVAEPIQALGALAEQLGAQLIQNAGINDLAAATRANAIVILVAHWKGAEVSAADLLQDGPAMADALDDATDPELVRLGKASGKADSAQALAATLNAALERMAGRLLRAARESRGAERFVMLPQTAKARARMALDSALTGLLRPGECLELTDGLHDIAAVEQALAPAFSGVLDLTTCTSMILADRLGALRGGAFRCVQFEQALPPSVAALALRQTLATATMTPDGYLTARKAAIEAVAEAIASEAKRTLRRSSWFRFFR